MCIQTNADPLRAALRANVGLSSYRNVWRTPDISKRSQRTFPEGRWDRYGSVPWPPYCGELLILIKAPFLFPANSWHGPVA